MELFDKVPAVRERYARRFRFVMVDEYQDTNRPQYLLVKQLASVHRNLCRRRRSRPVDLQVARRRPAQHPRLRARLSRRRHRPARAQLPLDAGDPRRGVGGDRQQPRPQGQDAVDRSGRRRARSVTSAAPTSSKRPTSSRSVARGDARRRRQRARRRCCIAPTRSRARWRTALRPGRHRLRRARRRRASTSARRSRTRWRT